MGFAAKELIKVKSESSIKMDEILQNYNNYKRNKQQFMEELHKPQHSHQRFASSNLTEELQVTSRNKIETKSKEETIPQTIDYLWNDVSNRKYGQKH